MEVENVILALFDFDEQACNVDRYASSFDIRWQQRLSLQWACEHLSGGIIVVRWENIEYIDTKSIIYAHWGVGQEGTSLGDYLGPKSEAERFCVESMINKYLVAVIFTSDKQGRRNDMLKDGPGAQLRL